MKVFGVLFFGAFIGLLGFAIGNYTGALSRVFSGSEGFLLAGMLSPGDRSSTLFVWPESDDAEGWRVELRSSGTFRPKSQMLTLGPKDHLIELPVYSEARVSDVVMILPLARRNGAIAYGTRICDFLKRRGSVPGLHIQHRDLDWDEADSFSELLRLMNEDSQHIMGAVEALFSSIDGDFEVDYIVASAFGKPDHWILAGDRLGAKRTSRDAYSALRYYRRINEMSTAELCELYRQQGDDNESLVEGCHILLIVAADGVAEGTSSAYALVEKLTQLAVPGCSVTVRVTDIPQDELGDIETFGDALSEVLSEAGNYRRSRGQANPR